MEWRGLNSFNPIFFYAGCPAPNPKNWFFFFRSSQTQRRPAPPANIPFTFYRVPKKKKTALPKTAPRGRVQSLCALVLEPIILLFKYKVQWMKMTQWVWLHTVVTHRLWLTGCDVLVWAAVLSRLVFNMCHYGQNVFRIPRTLNRQTEEKKNVKMKMWF